MELLHHIPTKTDIEESHQTIQPFIHRTPVLSSESLNQLTGAEVFFKCENFQKIGAFKMRGAINTALRLSDKQKAKGLATHSSGNHAQAVAKSAQILGIPAYIVMPKNAPAVKVAATKGYGASVIFCESTTQAREQTLAQVVAEKNAFFIHPYNDYNVIAGQATVAKELLEDLHNSLDIILAPVGGGGLMSGTSLSCKYFSPNTRVFAAEPQKVDDAFRAMQSGKIEKNDSTDTIADGLRTPLSERTFPIIRDHVEQILLVSEESIIHAMQQIWERMKIIVEPSSAVPLAAVFSYPEHFQDKRVGIIITGGNVDVKQLPFKIATHQKQN